MTLRIIINILLRKLFSLKRNVRNGTFPYGKHRRNHFRAIWGALGTTWCFRGPGVSLDALGGAPGDPEGGPVLQNMYVLIKGMENVCFSEHFVERFAGRKESRLSSKTIGFT